MNRIVVTLLVLMCATCCTLTVPVYDYETIMHSVHDTLTYKYESGDHWQPAEETEELRTGDCEDFAIYMLYRVGKVYGVYGHMVVIMQDGEELYHAVVLLDQYYDPVNDLTFSEVPVEWDVRYELSYGEILWRNR